VWKKQNRGNEDQQGTNLNDFVSTMSTNFLLIATWSTVLSTMKLPQSTHALHPVQAPAVSLVIEHPDLHYVVD